MPQLIQPPTPVPPSAIDPAQALATAQASLITGFQASPNDPTQLIGGSDPTQQQVSDVEQDPINQRPGLAQSYAHVQARRMAPHSAGGMTANRATMQSPQAQHIQQYQPSSQYINQGMLQDQNGAAGGLGGSSSVVNNAGATPWDANSNAEPTQPVRALPTTDIDGNPLTPSEAARNQQIADWMTPAKAPQTPQLQGWQQESLRAMQRAGVSSEHIFNTYNQMMGESQKGNAESFSKSQEQIGKFQEENNKEAADYQQSLQGTGKYAKDEARDARSQASGARADERLKLSEARDAMKDIEGNAAYRSVVTGKFDPTRLSGDDAEIYQNAKAAITKPFGGTPAKRASGVKAIPAHGEGMDLTDPATGKRYVVQNGQYVEQQ